MCRISLFWKLGRLAWQDMHFAKKGSSVATRCVLLLVMLLAARSTDAEELLACSGTSYMSGKEVQVTLHSRGKKLLLEIDGQEYKIRRTMEADLPNVPEVLECDIESDCFDRLVRNRSDSESLLYGEVAMLGYTTAMGLEWSSSFELDAVASARKYVASQPSKFGTLGLTEFLDSDGELLGRFLFRVEPIECR